MAHSVAKPRATFPIATLLTTLLLVASGGVAACGGPQVKPVDLDPVEFKVDRSTGQPKVYEKNHDALVEEGMARFKAGEWAEAARLLDLAAKEFPQSPSLYALRYNAGLALARLGRHEEAADRFAQAQKLAAGSRSARDALFQRAEALEEAKRFADAAALYKAALSDEATQQEIGGALGLLDELEATTRLGVCYRRSGEITKADEAFRRVERLYQERRDVQLVAESEWVAQAMYERGEIFRELFTTIRFKLPVERMKRDLEDKANLFLKAENSYFHCVRLHHKRWSLAAGFEIGALYTRLIDDIENAEVPEGLDDYTKDVYRDELWNHTERLAKRATVIYRKNIELAETLGQKTSDWVKKSEQGLERMEKMIEANNQRRLRLMQTPPPTSKPEGQGPTPPAPKAPTTG